MEATLRLIEPKQAHAAIRKLWDGIKPVLADGKHLELSVRPEKRSTEANALLHSILQEISETREWAGSRRSVEVWKRLMTAAWLRARGEHVEILPALDGHGADIVFRRTSELTKLEFAELIEYVSAWQAENS